MTQGAHIAAATAVLVALLAACGEPAPLATVPYRDDFSTALGPEWRSASGRWLIEGGRLFNDGAHNVPLWLSATLPRDVRISFNVESKSPEVDFKCELFGDGKRHESGYIVIFAGWKNTKSLIARMDEHGADAVGRAVKLEPNRVYAVTVERRGDRLRSLIDGELHVEYVDPAPLEGRGHDRFAFSNWASVLYFDDLHITPLEP